MIFINFGATYFGGILETGDNMDEVDDVETEDLVTLELRFGPDRSQKAHRFAVSETGGTNGNGGPGIPYDEYMYRDYVDIPFEAWDMDNDRQLMVSFRDQADDGEWNLIHEHTSDPERDLMSREYFFISGFEYDEDNPHDDIATDGGLVSKLFYFMWPVLHADATWDPESVPESTLKITIKTLTAETHSVANWSAANNAVHVDHHNFVTVDTGGEDFAIFNVNDGGVHYSRHSGNLWRGISNGYNTSQFYGVAKRPGHDQYLGGTQDNGTWLSGDDPSANDSWSWEIGGDGFDTVWHQEDDNLLLGGWQNNNFRRSTNRGATWSDATSGLDDVGREAGPFINTLGSSASIPLDRRVSGAPRTSRSFGLRTEYPRVTGVFPGLPGRPASRWQTPPLSGLAFESQKTEEEFTCPRMAG